MHPRQSHTHSRCSCERDPATCNRSQHKFIRISLRISHWHAKRLPEDTNTSVWELIMNGDTQRSGVLTFTFTAGHEWTELAVKGIRVFLLNSKGGADDLFWLTGPPYQLGEMCEVSLNRAATFACSCDISVAFQRWRHSSSGKMQRKVIHVKSLCTTEWLVTGRKACGHSFFFVFLLTLIF